MTPVRLERIALGLAALAGLALAGAPGPSAAGSGAAPGGTPAVRKIVAAHRGASGYFPEHTLPAYTLAHAQGADLIEPDVVMTKDGVLVCLHDLYLETTTDVAERFPDRKRPNGHWYAADFTLEELRRLAVFGRGPVAEREELPALAIPTLEDLIRLVRRLNRTTGRSVGLLIETKDPEFHRQAGLPLERPLLALLERYGYRGKRAGVVIQSFDAAHLKRLRTEHGADLPLMYLTSRPLSDAQIAELAGYVDGINPQRRVLEGIAAGSDAGGAPRLVEEAHRRGLQVFVWTFDAEEAAMRRFLWRYGVDGVITNHPDVGVRAARPPQATE